MESIGVVIYCQGFLLPSPHGYLVREMGLCDLSGKQRRVYAYEHQGTSYDKLTTTVQKSVDEQCAVHGVCYEPKYPNRPQTCLSTDFDTFVTKYATQPSVGVWAGDAVAQAFLDGLGVSTVVLPHDNLQTLPLGSVLQINEQYRNEACSGHGSRQCSANNDDEDDYMHRCSLEFACALAALVRKETHYRSPTLVQDLLYQKNLWQYRMERLLDVMMCCTDCAADMSRAFDRGEGLSWYPECDTSPCCFVKSIFHYGVFDPWPDRWNPSDYQDSTLDTMSVLTPVEED